MCVRAAAGLKTSSSGQRTIFGAQSVTATLGSLTEADMRTRTPRARRAVDAGQALASELRKTQGDGSVFPAGVGVHTGVGYVGVIGEPGSYDFTVQGDVANTTARLGSSAANGELILSDAIVAESGLSTAAFSRRLLDLKGKAQPTEAWWNWRLEKSHPSRDRHVALTPTRGKRDQ